MKIEIDARLLEDLVSTVAQAIGSKPMNMIGECVYIEVHSESGTPFMTVFAKDDGIAIRKVTDRVTVIDDGEALIPAKTLMAFVKLMDGNIQISVDEHGKCQMKCGDKKTSISGLNAEDYNAEFYRMQDELSVTMDGNEFERSVLSTQHCVSADQGRKILTGINFAFHGETGKCEATGMDGPRMARVKISAETNDDFNETIPINSAKLIAKIMKDKKNVSFIFGSGVVIAEGYDVAVEATLLSGEYPNVDMILERQGDGKLHAKVNGSELMQALKLAMIAVQDGQKGLVTMKFDGADTMHVSSRSESSDATSVIPCGIIGVMDNRDEIAFNGKYLIDALKVGMEYGEEMTMKFNGNVNPVVIVPVNRDDYMQLVLPVRRL